MNKSKNTSSCLSSKHKILTLTSNLKDRHPLINSSLLLLLQDESLKNLRIEKIKRKKCLPSQK